MRCMAIWYGSRPFAAVGAGGAHASVVLVVAAAAGQIVQEMAARSVRAQADAVECATVFGLVLGMTLNGAQLIFAVRKLALFAVFAFAGLLEWAAQFRLVAARGNSKT